MSTLLDVHSRIAHHLACCCKLILSIPAHSRLKRAVCLLSVIALEVAAAVAAPLGCARATSPCGGGGLSPNDAGRGCCGCCWSRFRRRHFQLALFFQVGLSCRAVQCSCADAAGEGSRICLSCLRRRRCQPGWCCQAELRRCGRLSRPGRTQRQRRRHLPCRRSGCRRRHRSRRPQRQRRRRRRPFHSWC